MVSLWRLLLPWFNKRMQSYINLIWILQQYGGFICIILHRSVQSKPILASKFSYPIEQKTPQVLLMTDDANH
jgi:hypothetical protein